MTIHEWSEGSTMDQRTAAASARPLPTGRYVVVFEKESSRVVPLPERGELIVGRAPDVAIVLNDTLVSRQHARLALTPEGAILLDLDSQNGTYVNEERVLSKRTLVPGDVVAIGGTRLVYASGRSAASRVLRPERFCELVASEIERAAEFGRALSIVALDFTEVEELLAPTLGPAERIAFIAPTEVVACLAERGGDEAARRASAWLEALAPPAGRAGFALYPGDTSDPDALVALARAAARSAAPGAVARATDASATIRIGEDEAIVADPAMVRPLRATGKRRGPMKGATRLAERKVHARSRGSSTKPPIGA